MDKETSESRAKEVMPGPLKDGVDFLDWEARLQSTLYLRYGAKDLPLAYVTRPNDDPAPADEEFANFTEECMARTLLEGPAFEQDDQTVHFIVEALVAKQPAETFIKPHRQLKSGRTDCKSLTGHFKGHGNKAKLKAEADGLKNTLHYKNEKALPFDTYLQRVEKMIHLYAHAEEPMVESAQISFLLDNIKDPALSSAVGAVKAAIAVQPTSFTLIAAYNHISAEVKKENVPAKRGIGAVTQEGGALDTSPIMDANGKIRTDNLPANVWHSLDRRLKTMVLQARGRGKEARKED
jgi:hypothetical protein